MLVPAPGLDTHSLEKQLASIAVAKGKDEYIIVPNKFIDLQVELSF